MSFDDTATAFSYKTDRELQKANLIFSLVNHPWISGIATGFTKTAFNVGLPIEGIIKKTVFSHFCGGETIAESERTIQTLSRYNVGTILDYSVEGEDSDADFDRTTAEVIRTIEKAASIKGVPFSVFKVTGLASFDLLEKVQSKAPLNAEEQSKLQHVRDRVDRICAKAFSLKVPVLIDAEDSWIQDPIDELAHDMMAKYNQSSAIVFNTYQLYRKDAFDNVRLSFDRAASGGYFFAAKLVRGAYMEKERERAAQKGYESPIHPDKAATDKAFNSALLYCMDRLEKCSVMCGSHNEYSNQYLTTLMDERSIANGDKRVWFAQLFGMSDNISFNLAKAGYNVAKYVPYGPVKSVMPYLLRRAEENTSVAGQSSRELVLIRKELRRRKGK